MIKLIYIFKGLYDKFSPYFRKKVTEYGENSKESNRSPDLRIVKALDVIELVDVVDVAVGQNIQDDLKKVEVAVEVLAEVVDGANKTVDVLQESINNSLDTILRLNKKRKKTRTS